MYTHLFDQNGLGMLMWLRWQADSAYGVANMVILSPSPGRKKTSNPKRVHVAFEFFVTQDFSCRQIYGICGPAFSFELPTENTRLRPVFFQPNLNHSALPQADQDKKW